MVYIPAYIFLNIHKMTSATFFDLCAEKILVVDDEGICAASIFVKNIKNTLSELGAML